MHELLPADQTNLIPMMLHVSPLHLNRISSGIYYSSILFPPLNSRIIFFFYSSIFHLAVFIPPFSYQYHFPCFIFQFCEYVYYLHVVDCAHHYSGWHLVLYVCITPRSDWCTIFTGQSPHKIKSLLCVSVNIYTPSVALFQTFHHSVSDCLQYTVQWCKAQEHNLYIVRFIQLRNKGTIQRLGRDQFLKQCMRGQLLGYTTIGRNSLVCNDLAINYHKSQNVAVNLSQV